MIFLSIAITIIVAFLGVVLGHNYMNSTELGIILAVATMGGFIMSAIRKINNTK